MLTHTTLDLLQKLGLHGMAKGFKELERQPEVTGLAHAEWLALLLEHEPHSSLSHLNRVLAPSSHDSILSTFGASGESGPIQFAL